MGERRLGRAGLAPAQHHVPIHSSAAQGTEHSTVQYSTVRKQKNRSLYREKRHSAEHTPHAAQSTEHSTELCTILHSTVLHRTLLRAPIFSLACRSFRGGAPLGQRVQSSDTVTSLSCTVQYYTVLLCTVL